MKRVQPLLGFLFAIGYAVSGGTAEAADYYVSPSGSDSRSCAEARSQSTPKLTLNSAVGCLTAGDTLQVRGGTYAEGLTYWDGRARVPSGASWSSKVRIAAYNGETVWMRPGRSSRVLQFSGTQQYIELDGINLDGTNVQYDTVQIAGGFPGDDAHHIRIKNAEVIGSSNAVSNGAAVIFSTAGDLSSAAIGHNEFINLKVHGGGINDFDHGFYLQSSDNLIDGCDIYDFTGGGIELGGDYASSANNNIIRNNKIHDSRRTAPGQRHTGYLPSDGNGNKFYNNVLYNITGGGYGTNAIYIYGGANNELYNNTVYGTEGQGIVIDARVSGTIVRNNIAYNNSGVGNYLNYGRDTVSSNNLTTDPGFIDAARGDFRLAAGSRAIDAGVYVAVVQSDLAGTARPQGATYDIGAFEFGSGSSTPAPAAPAPPPPPAAPADPGTASPSPDGTRIPNAAAIIDNSLGVWTLGSGLEIRRNGVQQAGGYASKILWHQGNIIVLGDDFRWWRWTGVTWVFHSTNDPTGR